VTPWDLVLALCIVAAVFVAGRWFGYNHAHQDGYNAGFLDGARSERLKRKLVDDARKTPPG
jgi:hypothetical protein